MSAEINRILIVPRPDGVASSGFFGGMVKIGCLYFTIPYTIRIIPHRSPFGVQKWGRISWHDPIFVMAKKMDEEKQRCWTQIASKHPILLAMVLINAVAFILALNFFVGGSMNTFRYMGF